MRKIRNAYVNKLKAKQPDLLIVLPNVHTGVSKPVLLVLFIQLRVID